MWFVRQHKEVSFVCVDLEVTEDTDILIKIPCLYLEMYTWSSKERSELKRHLVSCGYTS